MMNEKGPLKIGQRREGKMSKELKFHFKERPPKVTRISEERADDFLLAVKESNLSKENIKIAKMMIDWNRWIQEQLDLGTLTIAKLRRLFQIQGSEKAVNRNPKLHKGKDVLEDGKKLKIQGHGRNAAEAYEGAEIVEVDHPTLSPGDTCPAEACGGRLYEMSDPGVAIRVRGAPLATATRYHQQKLRCAVCETVYTAPLPKGVSEKKYDANFVAMLMVNKYFMAMPFYRQDRLQNYLGMPLPASTQWDLMVAHKEMLKALHEALAMDAANGDALCYDDTSVKILDEIKAKKLAEKGDKKQHTSFTTGLVSLHKDHRTYVYMTDNRVAGNFIGEIIQRRNPTLDLPILMCDALSANIPQHVSDDVYVLCYCLIHARRQFYELPDGCDDLADEVIRLIGQIYDHEAHAKALESKDRLAYHQKHSLPVMQELKEYLEEQALQFEPNGIGGKAIAYMLKRWTELTRFLEYAHAPLDTNLVEQALKLVIQTRKSSMFYKSLDSAAFASYVQSALYSAAQNNMNPCTYMTTLLEHASFVVANPQAWLPWVYQKTLKKLRLNGLKPKELKSKKQELKEPLAQREEPGRVRHEEARDVGTP